MKTRKLATIIFGLLTLLIVSSSDVTTTPTSTAQITKLPLSTTNQTTTTLTSTLPASSTPTSTSTTTPTPTTTSTASNSTTTPTTTLVTTTMFTTTPTPSSTTTPTTTPTPTPSTTTTTTPTTATTTTTTPTTTSTPTITTTTESMTTAVTVPIAIVRDPAASGNPEDGKLYSTISKLKAENQRLMIAVGCLTGMIIIAIICVLVVLYLRKKNTVQRRGNFPNSRPTYFRPVSLFERKQKNPPIDPSFEYLRNDRLFVNDLDKEMETFKLNRGTNVMTSEL
ncbi:hypothetical protein SNE40_013979 [Patella caerulea]|uniref:Uncharacterized protein n=1 Tax=Patella caerulea TaxID=87958 RepID=A0AAN8JCN7_PATCE